MIPGIVSAQSAIPATPPPSVTRMLLANQSSTNFYSYKNPLTTADFIENIDELGVGRCAMWSPNGVYAAFGSDAAPYLVFAKRSGDTLTTIAPTGTLPAGAVMSAAWSSDSSTVYIASTGGNKIYRYTRSGDVFTYDSSPGISAAGSPQASNALSLSADGAYVSMAHATSPYITTYRTSDWTKLVDPDVLPTGNGFSCAWHPGGAYLVVGHGTSPRVTLYSFASEAFTKLANPATIPANQGNGAGWNQSGSVLALAISSSPFWALYSFSGGVLTNISTASKALAGVGLCVAWQGDETVFLGHSSGNKITIYPVVAGVVGAAYTAPATTPTLNAVGVSVVSASG